MIDPDWNEEKFNLTKMLSRMRRTLANQYLISVTVQPDSQNTSNNVIYVSVVFSLYSETSGSLIYF